MAVVQAQKVPQKNISAEDTLATFCLFYQQYKYHEAKRLPFKRVVQMLKIARQERAKQNFDNLQISVAPHGAKGTAKKLAEQFKEQANG